MATSVASGRKFYRLPPDKENTGTGAFISAISYSKLYMIFFPFVYFGRLSNAQKLAIRLIRILKLRVAIRKFKVRNSALR